MSQSIKQIITFLSRITEVYYSCFQFVCQALVMANFLRYKCISPVARAELSPELCFPLEYRTSEIRSINMHIRSLLKLINMFAIPRSLSHVTHRLR